jgi:phosphate starvation-inducible PhoH-like protein
LTGVHGRDQAITGTLDDPRGTRQEQRHSLSSTSPSPRRDDEPTSATDRQGRSIDAPVTRVSSSGEAELAAVKVLVPGDHSMVALLGARDELLKVIEKAFDTAIHVRGNEITISGETDEVERVAKLFEELVIILERGQTLDAGLIRQTVRMLKEDAGERPSQVLSEALLTHRGRTIRPKTLGQKRYLDAIRTNTVTFGIGPAGTGKTYLAMGAAVQALRGKQVNRLILTRPAVEAGERLGFLPGTLTEKIDPYLKPLWDALMDMMEAEELAAHVDRGTIEVAPLAYMRGRAQPVSTPVATPTGFRPIGELAPGDLVVGSDGRPTVVLGVFPQGRKEVLRVTTQDGASTVACGEHLWAVWTRSDRRRGKGPRVLETREMMGRLRTAHDRNFELPVVEPVAFTPRDVPMDPYALGLLLGDGHETPGHGRGHRRGGSGGAVGVLDPRATASATRIPADYRCNSVDVRLGLLQGLLDSDRGVLERRGGRARVDYLAPDADTAADVLDLVRSLGGVAARSDAFVIDIRLPEQLDPFRLERKLGTYREHGAGRPTRFIDAIEPAGEEQTVCIQVSAADSLYVTEDFLVTHNTLNDAFIVLDEAQNTTAEQMKMFLTRIGFNSKAVVTGDISQVDLPSGRKSGLKVVRDILADIEGVAFAYLSAGDVVRHHIVQRIVEAYEKHTVATEGASDGGEDR